MSDAPNILLFLGRFHPLLVHLPVGSLLLLAALELMACSRRFPAANASAKYILALLVPSALLSAICGWMLAGSGGYDPTLLTAHRWLGTATAVQCIALWLLHWLRFARLYRVCLFAGVGLLMVASHFGGSLTHGSDYLVRYAPRPIRSFLGRTPAVAEARLSATETGSFRTTVQPVLRTYCGNCHGREKQKGGLRMDSYDWLMRGGENGPVIIPGKPADSRLLRRVLLPLGHDDHMPPDGKKQPEPAEIEIVRAWIAAGAPRSTTIGQ